MITMMKVEFDIRDGRNPRCVAKLVSGCDWEKGHACDGPTQEDFERVGRGDDPIEALEDLMLGDLRRGLARAFGEAMPEIERVTHEANPNVVVTPIKVSP